jgi:putative nucleotidyltransferase with HDIG domain
MRSNIIAHSRQVMRVTIAMMDNLIEPARINTELVIASALLHDIAKTRTLETKEKHHDIIGGEILRSIGQIKIAEIVESHVFLKNYNESGPLEEREIVHYADKRVMHDVIVPLDVRISDLVDRYGINNSIKQIIIKNGEFVKKLEKKIQKNSKQPIEQIISAL